MPVARKHLIRLDQTNLYHCISRCVRRSFLCGKDRYSGQSFEHRRSWIEETMGKLSQSFCVEIAGYAIMSNHYHVILRVDEKQAKQLSDTDIIGRWSKLYKLPPIIQRYTSGEKLLPKETKEIKQLLQSWRQHLFSISRFMGYLNEHVARRANKEDKCTGRFWEGRFKSQAILDDIALLKTLVYVDLNPVRASMVKVPEEADYTSLKQRLIKNSALALMAFMSIETEPEVVVSKPTNQTTKSDCAISQGIIPITFKDYLALVDWTGRQSGPNKQGGISCAAPSILARLGIPESDWHEHTQPNKYWKNCVIGSLDRVQAFAQSIKQKWCWQRSGEITEN